ncbi:hypothetical protein ACRRTK_009243 [Alexandromys fortis]
MQRKNSSQKDQGRQVNPGCSGKRDFVHLGNLEQVTKMVPSRQGVREPRGTQEVGPGGAGRRGGGRGRRRRRRQRQLRREQARQHREHRQREVLEAQRSHAAAAVPRGSVVGRPEGEPAAPLGAWD